MSIDDLIDDGLISRGMPTQKIDRRVRKLSIKGAFTERRRGEPQRLADLWGKLFGYSSLAERERAERGIFPILLKGKSEKGVRSYSFSQIQLAIKRLKKQCDDPDIDVDVYSPGFLMVTMEKLLRDKPVGKMKRRQSITPLGKLRDDAEVQKKSRG